MTAMDAQTAEQDTKSLAEAKAGMGKHEKSHPEPTQQQAQDYAARILGGIAPKEKPGSSLTSILNQIDREVGRMVQTVESKDKDILSLVKQLEDMRGDCVRVSTRANQLDRTLSKIRRALNE